MKNLLVATVALVLVGCTQSYKRIVIPDESATTLDENGNLTQCIYDGVKYSLGAVIRQDDRNFYKCENTASVNHDQNKFSYWKGLE